MMKVQIDDESQRLIVYPETQEESARLEAAAFAGYDWTVGDGLWEAFKTVLREMNVEGL